MITGERMAAVDENAAALGVPRKQLMESSGNAVARVVRSELSDVEGDRVTIVAGRGNNGGDGFVAARFLDEFDVSVRLLGRTETISTRIARENWEALVAADYDVAAVRDSTGLDLADPDLIVDAVLGTGISGALREPAATAARRMNDAAAPVVSVDVPSGFDATAGRLAEDGVAADHVVTFHDEKPGLSALDATVTVADIGIPAAAEAFVGPGDLRVLERDPEGHKGDFGEVLVVGGGPYAGAPALSARAALRAGADLVRVVCPGDVADLVQGYAEDLIVRRVEGDRLVPDHVDRVLELAADHDSIVLGPGIGDDDETLAAVEEILEAVEGTAVVDADALGAVPDVTTDADLLCTPHQGELRGMGGETSEDWRERRDLVAAFAADLGHTLLVKGKYDVISDGTTTRINRTGNPGMTVGGTGDVLAGIAGAFLGRTEAVRAAGMAAYVNGRAGDAVREERGDGLLASDLVDAIPDAVDWPDA